MLAKILDALSLRPPKIEKLLPYPEGRRIYREFHNIRREQVDADALKVVSRLGRHGHRSFLVGGCVRDMLLGRKPKDFDVVTSATPAQVNRVFSNSRLIGRRFKIVHILFRGGKVIEVSTFRGLPPHRLQGSSKKQDLMLRRDNRFGTAQEDAARRDFTLNSLFFDPRNESIIDYAGGFDDIEEKRIVSVGDADISFREDPIRMLRAAKFKALLDFRIESRTARAIRRKRDQICRSSSSRLMDEFFKIFRTGSSFAVFESLYELGLLKAIVPNVYELVHRDSPSFRASSLGRRLLAADRLLSERQELTTTIFLALLLADLVGDILENRVSGNKQDYLQSRLSSYSTHILVPKRDASLLMQIFISQPRFYQPQEPGSARASIFRSKPFFYEAFMIFKINAIAEENEENIQRAMFWEIGPRSNPPPGNRVINLFYNRWHSPRATRNSWHDSEGRHEGRYSASGRRRAGGRRPRPRARHRGD